MLRRLWLVISLLWLAFCLFAGLTGFMRDEERVLFIGLGLIPWAIKYVAIWIIGGNRLASRFLLK
jgi:hypothetical protein